MSARLVSYAQNNEDMVLHVLLHRVTEGFYVDVGANHPTEHSVTRFFYDRGWRGINIEPNPTLHRELERQRPRDTNLNIGASDHSGSLVLRRYVEAFHGLSTFEPAVMEQHSERGLPHEDHEVAVEPLSAILERFAVDRIDFLKIDAEGHELQVLAGNDWDRFRPTVVVTEASVRESTRFMADRGYEREFFDGLNFYFLDPTQDTGATIWDYSNILLAPGYVRMRELMLEQQIEQLEEQVTARAESPHLAAAAAALERARRHSDLGGLDPGPTRFRRTKALALRLMRVATHHQVAHNRSMEEAVTALIEEAGKASR